MRKIEQTKQFKRDYKREAKGSNHQKLASEFTAVVTALVNDQPLAEKHCDHALTDDWKDHRDCHIKPDKAGTDPENAGLFSLSENPFNVQFSLNMCGDTGPSGAGCSSSASPVLMRVAS